MAEKISEVFKTVGQPTITYVKRDSGKLEQLLGAALDEPGQLCLVTGPSKTGKTTLYREVLKQRGKAPLVVQCDVQKTCDSLWLAALEAIDFARLESQSIETSRKTEIEASAEGSVGPGWFANLKSRLAGTVAKGKTETETHAKVLADPGPDLLIPVLKNSDYILVIEDFHYLPDEQKTLLFQQWKRFVDNEITVLVLGTAHRAVEIANSNRDLVGRIAQIDVGNWENSDLEQICLQGFKHLNVTISRGVIEKIASEAVGLPIIVQQTCLEIFNRRGISVKSQIPRRFSTSLPDVFAAFHGVATIKYAQFSSYYSTLISGPREKARKYRTYELVLACFTLDPIKFSLRRLEIDQRMTRLGLEPSEMPPAASMNSTLGALKNFQEHRRFRLLEWMQTEDVLYIVEPAFLFYVRWRKVKGEQAVQLDLFEELIGLLDNNHTDLLSAPTPSQ